MKKKTEFIFNIWTNLKINLKAKNNKETKKKINLLFFTFLIRTKLKYKLVVFSLALFLCLSGFY